MNGMWVFSLLFPYLGLFFQKQEAKTNYINKIGPLVIARYDT